VRIGEDKPFKAKGLPGLERRKGEAGPSRLVAFQIGLAYSPYMLK
jgi:hypothetical protein